ncbi:hypothetical protein ACFWU3_29625 [Streptomyces sp. NPDC058685]|uniref:hypothetical protein n=1 Tax=Streptomyces sp. NPDC058685 TaxID=3346598 RepID=UPI00365322BB
MRFSDADAGGDGGGEVLPERCGLCGVLMPGESVPSAVVRDSSAIHVHDPWLDGRHRVVACSPEHLEELVDRYGRRPFENAELWAGKIARVIATHPTCLSVEELAYETGLTVSQVDLGALWQNEHVQRHRPQPGATNTGPPGGDSAA